MQLLRSKKFVIPLTVLFAISALLYGLWGTKRVAMDWAPLYLARRLSLHVLRSMLCILQWSCFHKKVCSVIQLIAHFQSSPLTRAITQNTGAIDPVLKRTDKKKCAEMEKKPGQLNEDPALNFWMREQVESSYNTAPISIMTRGTPWSGWAWCLLATDRHQ